MLNLNFKPISYIISLINMPMSTLKILRRIKSHICLRLLPHKFLVFQQQNISAHQKSQSQKLIPNRITSIPNCLLTYCIWMKGQKVARLEWLVLSKYILRLGISFDIHLASILLNCLHFDRKEEVVFGEWRLNLIDKWSKLAI